MTDRPPRGTKVKLTVTGTVLGYLEPPKDQDLLIVDIDLATHSFKTDNSLAFYVGDPKIVIEELDS